MHHTLGLTPQTPPDPQAGVLQSPQGPQAEVLQTFPGLLAGKGCTTPPQPPNPSPLILGCQALFGL